MNLLRGTVAGFAAGVGRRRRGHRAAVRRRAGRRPTPFSRRIARNTQSLLVEEAHLARVIDPAGGSWYVESLTDELARAGLGVLPGDRGGGRGRRGARLRAGRRRASRPSGPARETDVATRRAPDHRASASSPTCREAGAARRPGPARGPGLGRRACPSTGPRRRSRRCRDRSDAHLAATGARPRAFLATLGPLAAHTARAGFARNLFHAGRHRHRRRGAHRGRRRRGRRVPATRARPVAVLCSTDALYAERAAAVVAGAARRGRAARAARGHGAGATVSTGTLSAGGDALAVLDGMYAAIDREGGRAMTIPDFTTVSLDTAAAPAGLDAWKAALGDGGRAAGVGHPGGHRRQAALHGRRPARRSTSWTPTRASRRTCAARTRRCTSPSRGPIRQYAGFSTAEESNAFYRRNLAAGQKGLSIAFDLATHRGYDSDHPRVAGDVGMAGRGDRLDLRHAAALRRHPARQDDGVDDDERRGAAGARALHRRGRGAGRRARAAGRDHPERHPQGVHGPQHLHLPARSRRCGSSPTSSRYTSREMPKFNSISISGYHIQEAGATADLELAYTLADGVEYLRAGHRRRAWTSTRSRRGCRSSGRSA